MPEARGLPPQLDNALEALVTDAGAAVSFTVHPEPESVTDARHFATSRLRDWGLGGLIDDVGLVVSELVTNALRHSGGAVTPWRDDHICAYPGHSTPAVIRLRLFHEAPWLLCGIMDASPAAPRRKEPDYIAETGRGLHLVESFSNRWGWRRLSEGKIVWALFHLT
ncbi:ATP-binding protein [Spirillospora sp. CA-294931]|uniref:ATP-binding protein n=1 Tax=Spirillospora sp. CA-294931 TaxID=3240042 RepID=UPI003D8BB2C6